MNCNLKLLIRWCIRWHRPLSIWGLSVNAQRHKHLQSENAHVGIWSICIYRDTVITRCIFLILGLKNVTRWHRLRNVDILEFSAASTSTCAQIQASETHSIWPTRWYIPSTTAASTYIYIYMHMVKTFTSRANHTYDVTSKAQTNLKVSRKWVTVDTVRHWSHIGPKGLAWSLHNSTRILLKS